MYLHEKTEKQYNKYRDFQSFKKLLFLSSGKILIAKYSELCKNYWLTIGYIKA